MFSKSDQIGKKKPKKKQRKHTPKALKTRRENLSEFDKMVRELWEEAKDRKGRVFCEESGRYLGTDFPEKSGMCFSHILSRGSHPELATVKLNINILHPDEHRKWEDSKEKKTMKIYKSNLKRIETLKQMAQQLRKGYGSRQSKSNQED